MRAIANPISTTRRTALWLPLLAWASHCHAEDGTPAIPGAGNAIFALAVVVLVIFGAAWLLKRVQPARPGGSALLHAVSTLSLGPRERIAVVEIGEQWLIVGVTAQTITPLHTMPRGALPSGSGAATALPFSPWLARARGKSDDIAP